MLGPHTGSNTSADANKRRAPARRQGSNCPSGTGAGSACSARQTRRRCGPPSRCAQPRRTRTAPPPADASAKHFQLSFTVNTDPSQSRVQVRISTLRQGLPPCLAPNHVKRHPGCEPRPMRSGKHTNHVAGACMAETWITASGEKRQTPLKTPRPSPAQRPSSKMRSKSLTTGPHAL